MVFETKDSGKRETYDSGMVRDVRDGKTRYDLVDRTMLKRWAELMGRGADKYGDDNWRLANSDAELKRFKESAFRHFMQWLEGETDEDHAAAVFFNIAAAEYVLQKTPLFYVYKATDSVVPEFSPGNIYPISTNHFLFAGPVHSSDRQQVEGC